METSPRLPLLLALTRHDECVQSVSFHPDGDLLATVSGRTVRLWHASSGQFLRAVQTPPGTSRINQIDFSPDGAFLASAAEDGTVYLWDPSTGAPFAELEHAGWMLSRKEGDVEVVEEEGRDEGRGGELGGGLAAARGPRAVLNNLVRFSQTLNHGRNHMLLATLCPVSPSTPVLWDVSAAMAPVPQASAATNATASTTPWPTLPTLLFRLAGHTKQVTALCLDERMVVSASHDGTARVFSAHTGAQLRVLRHHDAGFSGVTSVALSPTGRFIATLSSDKTLRLWDGDDTVAEDDDKPREIASHVNGASLAFSHDGSIIAAACLDGTARLWEADSGACSAIVQHRHPLTGLCFGAHSTLLATASSSTARIWDVSDVTVKLPIKSAAKVW